VTNFFGHLASLTCILCLLALSPSVARQKPAGLTVYLGVACVEENARQLLLSYLPGGKLWLNDYAFDEPGLRAKIKEIMETREVKVIWIGADERVPYGEVATLVDKLQQDTPDLKIGIATKSQIGPVDPDQLEPWRIEDGLPHPIETGPPPCPPESMLRP
jgi:biopolymer transport protein ExbD